METTVANTVPFNDGCIIEKWKITMIVLAKPTSLLKVANNAHGDDNENNVDRDIDVDVVKLANVVVASK